MAGIGKMKSTQAPVPYSLGCDPHNEDNLTKRLAKSSLANLVLHH